MAYKYQKGHLNPGKCGLKICHVFPIIHNAASRKKKKGQWSPGPQELQEGKSCPAEGNWEISDMDPEKSPAHYRYVPIVNCYL